MKNNKIFLLLIIFIGIGFAYLSTTLSITGRGLFGKSDWKIYFDNIREIEGMDYATIVPEVSGDTTTNLNFEVELPYPGNKYSFYVDVVNDGDLDAMINVLTNSNINSEYADFKVTYFDGTELGEKDLLKEHNKEILLVEVSYRTDIELDTLTSDKDPIDITISLEYSQADNTSNELIHYIYSSSDVSYMEGQLVPDYNYYLNYEGAVDAFGYPLYLRHKLSNMKIIESSVGFIKDGINYLIDKPKNRDSDFINFTNRFTSVFGEDECYISGNAAFCNQRRTDDFFIEMDYGESNHGILMIGHSSSAVCFSFEGGASSCGIPQY